jgi:hypothetical protein
MKHGDSMSSASAESARRTPPKIEFSCSCGKKYRVPASRAGKKVRCKQCLVKVRVPGDPAISLRTRRAILDELGIDAEAAEKKFEEEKVQGYVCTLCAAALHEDELPAAYGEEGLVCSTCRAAAVEQRGEQAEQAKKKKQDVKWSRQGSVEDAKKRAYALGALIGLGSAGFIHSFFAPHLALTILGAVVMYFVGYSATFKAYEPETPKKK